MMIAYLKHENVVDFFINLKEAREVFDDEGKFKIVIRNFKIPSPNAFYYSFDSSFVVIA